MLIPSIALLCSLFLLSSQSGVAPATQDEFGELRGEWGIHDAESRGADRVTFFLVNGDFPENVDPVPWYLSISGKAVTFRHYGAPNLQATLTVDRSKDPCAMDVTFELPAKSNQPAEKHTIRAIYKIETNAKATSLTVCFGSETERPKDFQQLETYMIKCRRTSLKGR